MNHTSTLNFDKSLLFIAVSTFVLGLFLYRLAIPLALRMNWVDVPSSRRRHQNPMPIIGGVTLFIAWAFSLTCYSLLHQGWFSEYQTSIIAISTSLGLLIGLGLVDDLKGVGPVGKLFFQTLAAVIVISSVPKVNLFCLHWVERIGLITWPLAVLWLVGLSNAINLVDGLDGLAGGISLLVSASLLVLSTRWGSNGELSLVLMALLIPAIASFLFYNWHPAAIFLGDNGSLPLGFLIGTVSLMCPTENRTWVELISILLMMGYPILDMGLCTLRRYRKNNPLFKADRNHLHHRLLRLGLTVPQAGRLLLTLTLYLQINALCALEFMNSLSGVLYVIATGFGLFSLLYLLRSIEHNRVARLSQTSESKLVNQDEATKPYFKECLVAHIELEPLFETGLFEEKNRIFEIVQSLKLMLQNYIRKEDIIYLSGHSLYIVYTDTSADANNTQAIKEALKDKLILFRTVYNLQYSLADLPVSFSKQEFLMHQQKIFDVTKKQAA